MTLLDTVLRRPSFQASIENPSTPLTSATLLDALGMSSSTDSGSRVTQKTAMGLPAVWRSVNLIAGGSASLPFSPFTKQHDVRKPLREGWQAQLIDCPHPDLTPFELWELIYGHLSLWGNGYLQKLRNQSGQVAELWPIHPGRVTPGRSSDTKKVYKIEGYDEPLTDREILHIPGFGFDGVVGLSPIQLSRQGLGLSLAAEKYGAKLFGSGSLASGILKTDRKLTQPQADALKDRWKAKAGGLDNAHDIVVLDSGASFEALSIPPEDAQFIESRRFQIAEIARMFGVPAHMLMETDKSTSWGSGIEQMGIGFVVYTLRPWLTRVEQRVTQMLNNPDAVPLAQLPRKPEAKVYAHYSVDGLLRGDTAARYKSYAIGRQWGWLSANDVRRFEDQPPLPTGGDDYIVPLNMTAEDIALAADDDVVTEGAPNAA
jgi:HK97 family phage portal protein